jgi:uncharacterized protein (TIGR03000 family)
MTKANVVAESVRCSNGGGGYGWGGGWGGGYADDWYGPRSYANSPYYTPYYYSSWGWGRPYYYSGWGWNRPFYSGYYRYPSYSYMYPSSGTIVYEEPAATSGDTVRSQSFYRAPAGSNQCMLRVLVPFATADVLIENQATQQQGTDRLFISPALDPNASYSYTVKAKWMDNGQEATREKSVNVSAGGSVTVDFGEQQGSERIPVPSRQDDRSRGSDRYLPPKPGGVTNGDNLIQGTILRVDGNDIVISLLDGTRRTFHMTGSNNILLDGQRTEIRNLQPGMPVTATMRAGAAADAAPMKLEAKKGSSDSVKPNNQRKTEEDRGNKAPDRAKENDKSSPPPP